MMRRDAKQPRGAGWCPGALEDAGGAHGMAGQKVEAIEEHDPMGRFAHKILAKNPKNPRLKSRNPRKDEKWEFGSKTSRFFAKQTSF